MIQIFLSHNTRDREWCEWLKVSAAELGVQAYLAEHDVQAGTNLAAKVSAAIDASEAVVVLLSDNSATAPYVHQEIGYGLKAGKLIIPLVQPGVEPQSLAMLQGVEYIPFDFERPNEGHVQLRRALQRLVTQHHRREAARQESEREAARQQRDAALVALACVALILLTLDSG